MAGISSKAAGGVQNRFKFNGGSELEEELGVSSYSTFFRRYDQQIGRFWGVDVLSEAAYSFSPFQFGFNNPISFNDPTGAKSEAPNPASFQNAGDLVDYILNHGIRGFDHQFTWMAFYGAGGAGGSTLSAWADGNINLSKSNANGITIGWTGLISNGHGGTLDEVVSGSIFISTQTLWTQALAYGEEHRDATYEWYDGMHHYDVMDAHNYDAFKSRLKSGAALSRSGDRKSYTESLSNFKNRYQAEQDGRAFEAGFVAGILSPVVGLYAGLAAPALSAAYTDLSIDLFTWATTSEEVSVVTGMFKFGTMALTEMQLYKAVNTVGPPLNLNMPLLNDIFRNASLVKKHMR